MLLASCAKIKEVAPSLPAPEVEEPAPKEQQVIPAVVVEPEPEPEIEEPAPEPAPIPKPEPEKEETPEPEPEPAKSAEDLEYERSVGNMDIPRNTFEDDKTAILRIIHELSDVMQTFDYRTWVTYVDKASIEYWSRPTNLRKAQSRLPIKGLQLKALEDYFKYVFVPARMGREVTEIRYISSTHVKAVHVTQEEKDIVYYYFNKINGVWKINIPPLTE